MRNPSLLAVRRRPTLQIGLGLLVGQAAVLGITPLVARLYTPSEVGRAGIFLALVSIFGVTSTFRLETRLAACPDGQVRPVLSAAAGCVLTLSVLTALAAGPWLGVGDALLLAVAVASLGLVTLGTQLAARVNELTGVAASKMTQGLGQAGMQLLSGASGATRFGLQAGISLGYLVSAATQWVHLRRRWHPEVQTSTPSLPRSVWLACAALTVATVINVATVWAQLLLLDYGYSKQVVGQFNLARTLSIAPAGLVVAALSPPLIAAVGVRLRSAENAWAPIRRILFTLAPVTALATVTLILMPADAVTSVLGADWAPVDGYMAGLAPLVFGLVVVGPVSQVLAILQHTTIQLIWDLTRAFAVVSVGLVMVRSGRSAEATVLATSTILLLWYFAYVLLVRHLLTRKAAIRCGAD